MPSPTFPAEVPHGGNKKPPLTEFLEFSLSNASLSARISNFGATLTHLFVKDRNGIERDVVLGYDEPRRYLSDLNNPYFGAIVGRVANRISKGLFTLNDTVYQIAVNNGPNHLHGGLTGFSQCFWEVLDVQGDSVKFQRTSANGEENYPGSVTILVEYKLVGSALEIKYNAELLASPPTLSTIINLTNHTYFNLHGTPKLVLDHVAHFPRSSRVLDVDSTMIPTGILTDVSQTPFDFTVPEPIGSRISRCPDFAKGYDNCFVVDPGSDSTSPTAIVTCPETGLRLTMYTTEPAFQFYTGNFLDGSINAKATQDSPGIKRQTCEKHSGFCLEAGRFVDAVNRPEWRDMVVLKQGEVYRQQTRYEFDTVN